LGLKMQGLEVGKIRRRVDANPRRQMREFVQQVYPDFTSCIG
jgi:hypothetical protein